MTGYVLSTAQVHRKTMKKDTDSILFTIIIIMAICKAPTLRLKALNKHTHIMYIEMENVISKKSNNKKSEHIM